VIDINETKPGDVCYFLVGWQGKPIFGEIVKVFESEDAVRVLTATVGYRVVRSANAYWDEKEAKKGKYVAVKYNYSKQILESDDGEKESNVGISDVHHGKTEQDQDVGKEESSSGVQKSPRRKQKTVRSTRKSKDKTEAGRKTSRSQNKSS